MSRTLAEVEALVVELAEAARDLDRDGIKQLIGLARRLPRR